MRTINVALENRAYPVMVGSGLIGRGELWQRYLARRPVLLVTNDKVGPLYLDQLMAAIGSGSPETIILPDGEAEKTLANWINILHRLVEMKAGRDVCLVALGGGVVGDICGFAAAAYMRGVRYIQVPTTLLAQVDASVGGKTGVNLPSGKNLVGAFHQPSAVFADIDTLKTLDEREYLAGMAEVVKYGAIRDAAFLTFLENHTTALLARDPLAVCSVVEQSIVHKAEVVARDELETGVRASLNFGHSFAHAIETVTAYERYLHGEAVAIGMMMAATLSEQRKLCQPGFTTRLGGLLKRLQLPVTIPPEITADELLGAMRLDKKNVSGRRRLVLLAAPGEAVVDSASSNDEIRAAIESCRQSLTGQAS